MSTATLVTVRLATSSRGSLTKSSLLARERVSNSSVVQFFILTKERGTVSGLLTVTKNSHDMNTIIVQGKAPIL